MQKVIKAFVALITLTIGVVLGITLLSDFIWWKMLVFAGACYVIGQLVYKLLRIIDRRFSDQ